MTSDRILSTISDNFYTFKGYFFLNTKGQANACPFVYVLLRYFYQFI